MIPASDAEIERLVLMNAWEDYAPLWQIAGEVRDARPASSEADAIAAARRAARALLARGLVEVYRRGSRSEDYRRLSGAALDAALDGDDLWRASETETDEAALAVTKAGEAAYLSGKKDRA